MRWWRWWWRRWWTWPWQWWWDDDVEMTTNRTIILTMMMRWW
jgi:hypothetical protein